MYNMLPISTGLQEASPHAEMYRRICLWMQINRIFWIRGLTVDFFLCTKNCGRRRRMHTDADPIPDFLLIYIFITRLRSTRRELFLLILHKIMCSFFVIMQQRLTEAHKKAERFKVCIMFTLLTLGEQKLYRLHNTIKVRCNRLCISVCRTLGPFWKVIKLF